MIDATLPLTKLSDEALAGWLRVLNEQIDLIEAGLLVEDDAIPRSWVEDRYEEAFAERDRRQGVAS